jgi:alpha/beta superfamily hydrolase
MHDHVMRERVSIPGPRGALAGELAYAGGRPAYACAVLNPHPHMGGSAENSLVVAVAAAVARTGGVSLRFDYAGVGASVGPAVDLVASMAAFWESGRAPEDPGMVADAAAALRWLRRQAAGLPLALAGYSFGAYVATTCIDEHAPAAVAVISPTLARHDFSRICRVDTPPLLVVYGDDDFATPLQTTHAFIASLARRAQSHRVAGGEHFFRGREPAVAERVVSFFDGCLNPQARDLTAVEVAAC